MDRERENDIHVKLASALETIMSFLGFVWLALLILDFAYGLSPFFFILLHVIWGIFIIDFAARLLRAPDKKVFLRTKWLTAISLVIPALRFVRVLGAVRLFKPGSAVRLARLFTSFNRSARALASTMERRGAQYVLAVTLIVVFTGAAGMYTFERQSPAQEGFRTYWESLWWTAMLVTTIGSQHWPVTTEGKIICMVLAVYAITVLGYVAAALASYFIGQDTAKAAADVEGPTSEA